MSKNYQSFTCELCGKNAAPPNVILVHAAPMHIGCLVEDHRRLREAITELLAVVRAEAALYDGMDASEFAPETAARIRAMRDVLDKVNGGAA